MTLAVLLALATAVVSAAENDHVGHGMNYGNYTPGKSAHKEVVDGVKATFNIKPMQEAMQDMGMEMPKGVKETRHLSISFNDMQTGKAITSGEVKVKVPAPDKSEQTRELPAMPFHSGADFDLATMGQYGVMCKFVLKDGKTRRAKFWYTVKSLHYQLS